MSSIFNFGTFTDIFDNILIDRLEPKELFLLTQVNKYYNEKITKALPTNNVVKFIDSFIVKEYVPKISPQIHNAFASKIATTIRMKNITMFNKFTNTHESELVSADDWISLLHASIEDNSLNIFALLLIKVKHIIIFSPQQTLINICTYGNFKFAEILLNEHHYLNINLFICIAISLGNIEIAKKLDQKYNINNKINDNSNDCPITVPYSYVEITRIDFYEDDVENVTCMINPFVLAVELSEFDIIEYYLDNYKVDQKILNMSIKHLNMPYIVAESLHNSTIMPLVNRIISLIKTENLYENEDYCDLGKFQQSVNQM